ncbi:MAG: sugar phosphate nucleotidyltransferase [Patescibacteria group bacterium]
MENNNQKIKTIILCGGTGTRLKEETEFKPKPMVEVGGKPILWHIMKIYSHYGHQNFILALGYKGNNIKDHFLKQKYYNTDLTLNTKDGKVMTFDNDTPDNLNDDFNIIFADTGLETPTGGRVLKLKKYIIEDVFMVTYGDGISDIDIGKLVEFHKSHGKIATITGVHPASRWGLVNADESNTVTEFAQKPMLYDYTNGGFMVFNKEFFNFLNPGDMIEDALMRLIPQKQLALYKHDGFWYGMDTYRDFLFLNDLWEKDPKWKIWQN